MLRQTKIIATIGPACIHADILRAMLLAGTDVLRVNFSHADAATKQLIPVARKIAQEVNRPIAIIGDLQGPKIRIGRFKKKSITLTDGQPFMLECQEKCLGDENKVAVDYPSLVTELVIGDHLLLNDGLIELNVIQIVGSQIHCRVIEGGVLSNFKGLNRKGGGLAARTLTDKDKEDLRTAIELEVDYICLSFVKDAADIHQARALINQWSSFPIPIIAKIERTEALDDLVAIIQASDVIMVARGDLGVEVGAAEVPAIQKRIIELTRQHDKVVITATQMMESMIMHPQPTRAEVSDVANAILDGTDAVMLSAETATGLYPEKVISMMSKICLSTEKHAQFRAPSVNVCHYQRADQAIAMAASHAANHFPIQAIVTLTESGDTALWISRQHSAVPILAVSSNPRTIGRLSIVSNIFPILLDYHDDSLEEVNSHVLKRLVVLGYLEKNRFILLTRGRQIGTPGATNSIEIICV